MNSCFKFLLSIQLLILGISSSCEAEHITLSGGGFYSAFHGESTLHGFDGGVKGNNFSLEKGEEFVTLTVNVLDMTTGLRARDRRMYKMFDASRHPKIQGKIRVADMLKASHKELDSFPIFLKIRDQEHPITANVVNLTENEGEVQLDCTFSVSLLEFELEPPSVAFGTIQVAPDVSVKTNFLISQ